MRDIPNSLQAALDSGATHLARCWKLDRRDGVAMGFTDHDLDLSFDGVVFESDSGLSSSALETVTGLANDTHEVSGALKSDRITETDISMGRYD